MVEREATVLARRRSLMWRIHYWAALLATPFALMATLTGLFYAFTPQIERTLYGALDTVQVSGERASLDAVVAAALQSVPAGSSVKAVFPGDALEEGSAGSTRVSVQQPAAGQTTVYVDPYRVAVLGKLPEQQRFNIWARKLHSSLLQGERWRWMIELSASWMLVMLLTGVYLWWPRGSQSGLPDGQARGRRWWQQWHAFAGVLLGVLTLVMLTTGITWSKYAGAQVRALRDTTGQASPRAPTTLTSQPDGGEPLSWQDAWEVARQHAPAVSLMLTPPADAWGVWKVGNGDRRHPTQKVELMLDAYSGAVLYRAGWDEQTAFGKATAVGIPFHRGELGIWNQLLLLIFAGGVLFSLLSGWMMFFKRPRVAPLGLPPLLPRAVMTLPVPAWILAMLLLALLPTLLISAMLVILFELIWHWQSPRIAHR